MAESLAKFFFQSPESHPDKEETLEFISIFFPEFQECTIEKVLEKWGQNRVFEKNQKYLEKYLKWYPSIKRARQHYINDSGLYSKEDWVEILKQGELSELLNLLKDEIFKTIQLDENELCTILIFQAENTQDADALFLIGCVMLSTSAFKQQGFTYVAKSANAGNKMAMDYLSKRTFIDLLSKFPNATTNLSEVVKNSTDFLKFLTIMENMSNSNRYRNDLLTKYEGKYKSYLLLANYLWLYGESNTYSVKRGCINNIQNLNTPAALEICEAYHNNRLIRDKVFRTLSFQEYLHYIIGLVRKYEFYEK